MFSLTYYNLKCMTYENRIKELILIFLPPTLQCQFNTDLTLNRTPC